MRVLANVPLPWVVGFDGNDPNTVFNRIRDIDVEILPVEDVLDGPALAAVLDELPLRIRSRSDQRWWGGRGATVGHTFWFSPLCNWNPMTDLWSSPERSKEVFDFWLTMK